VKLPTASRSGALKTIKIVKEKKEDFLPSFSFIFLKEKIFLLLEKAGERLKPSLVSKIYCRTRITLVSYLNCLTRI